MNDSVPPSSPSPAPNNRPAPAPEEPVQMHEDDIPSDGRDLEGERAIERLQVGTDASAKP